METASLEPVDVPEVTVLVDNVVDINLPGTDIAFGRLAPATGRSDHRCGRSTGMRCY
jgi:hypothetical protein